MSILSTHLRANATASSSAIYASSGTTFVPNLHAIRAQHASTSRTAFNVNVLLTEQALYATRRLIHVPHFHARTEAYATLTTSTLLTSNVPVYRASQANHAHLSLTSVSPQVHAKTPTTPVSIHVRTMLPVCQLPTVLLANAGQALLVAIARTRSTIVS